MISSRADNAGQKRCRASGRRVAVSSAILWASLSTVMPLGMQAGWKTAGNMAFLFRLWLVFAGLLTMVMCYSHKTYAQSNCNEKLAEDTAKGELSAVREDLTNGAYVNARSGRGMTPLAQAAYMGHADVARLLLERGADVNVKDSNGRTPLFDAVMGVMGSYPDVVKVLLEFGAVPDEGMASVAQDAQTKNLLLNWRINKTQFVNSKAHFVDSLIAAGDRAVQAGQLREALEKYLAALQSAPEDTTPQHSQPIEKKVIKVVLHLNPQPAIPQDAIRHFAYAQAAVEEGQKDADPCHLNAAANELEKALRIAPWWAQAYFNLGAVLQKANRPGEAAQALQLYLLADPHAANAQDVQIEIYKLQYEGKQAQQ